MRYAFIRSRLNSYPKRVACRALGVSSSGYYRWMSAKPSKRHLENVILLDTARKIHLQSKETYGSPRIHAALTRSGNRCSRGRIERLMKQNSIIARRKKRFRSTTNSDHGYQISPNLLNRSFNTKTPNEVWASDVTYLWTKEGWLYLGVTLDLFSRRVIGWSMDKRLDAKLVVKGLDMALTNRRPNNQLIHHSDRGKEYACRQFRERLTSEKIQQSMSRKGDCWDNAVVESFFKSLKSEIGHIFQTREEAEAQVFEWIEVFYNRQRLHSSLGYMTPTEYEMKYVS